MFARVGVGNVIFFSWFKFSLCIVKLLISHECDDLLIDGLRNVYLRQWNIAREFRQRVNVDQLLEEFGTW